MNTNKRNQHGVPTKEVVGEFGVHWLHTSGPVNEKFFMALKDQKILANTCANCSFTYVPPRMFCDDCFDELKDDSYKELSGSAELYSFTEVHLDSAGKYMDPVFMGLIRLEGSSTLFYHKLVNIDSPSIGMKLKPSWSENRVGSLLDLAGFESA